MVLVMMSARELQRVEVLAEVAGGHMAAAVAAGHLGVGRRQLFRLLARFRAEGAAGLASRRRGRPSNRRTPEAVRAQALALVRERYADFGPTLAAEKLLALHGLKVGRETLRGWMAAAGLWASRKAHLARVHQPRPRRDRLGELVQVDGCEHPWLEGRGPPCSLLVFVDDATGRLMHLKLVPAESALAYMQATRDYVAAYGKPVAFYSDRHGIFRVNREARRGDGMTQFGRALRDLDIQILCAPSPQAKGRVERAHLTLQDRLVKELRLAGVATVEAANRFLPGFVADYNRRFAKPPRCPEDAHRRLAPYESLDEALAWREDRTVSAALTLSYNRMLLILDRGHRVARAAAGRRVTVYDYPDGRLAVRWKGAELPYRLFDKLQRVEQGAEADNKRLAAALAFAREEQAKAPPRRRRAHNPSRRAQGPGPFSA